MGKFLTKGLLILAILCIPVLAGAQDVDWQAWVHQKTKDIADQQATDHQKFCHELRKEINLDLKEISNVWPDCKTSCLGALKAMENVDRYFNGDCDVLELTEYTKTGDNSVLSNLWETRKDLKFLKEYLGDCK